MKKNCHTNQGPIFASVNREVSTVKSNLVGTDSLNYKKQDAEKLTRLRLSLDDKKVAKMRLKGNVRIQRAIYQSKSVHHANNLTGTCLYWAAGFICTLSRFRNWKKMGTETFFSETWTLSTASRKQTLTKKNNLIKNIWKLRKVLIWPAPLAKLLEIRGTDSHIRKDLPENQQPFYWLSLNLLSTIEIGRASCRERV